MQCQRIPAGHPHLQMATKSSNAYFKKQAASLDIYKIADLKLLSPSVYDAFRFLTLCRRRLLRKPHDPDFRFFSQPGRSEDVFIDVGANGGQAAVSFSIFNKSAKILSFEPNSSQERMLKRVKKLLGNRFDYKMQGLSNENTVLPLYIPFIEGLPISTRASLDRQIIEDYLQEQPEVQRRKMSIQEIEIELVTFDSLNQKATFVKIDVEGAEALVLEGMYETLSKQRPILMLESSESLPAASKILSEVNYEIFELTDDDILVPLKEPMSHLNNVFALPRLV
ncbi:MAG: FkbM family methyltransferase [Deltaproteobacteria bacterium]|nr:FkbM family methyltransferase [Deltaproteobacteria bacterium]